MNDIGNVVKAVCNYCKTQLSGASSSGTNHLRRHSEKCFLDHGGITNPKQSQLHFSGSTKGLWIFSQQETREKLARMVIQHEYPFNIVEHEGFIDFMQTAQPNFLLPGRLTLRNDCIKIFQKCKSEEMLKISKADTVAITTDLWTSSELTGYMVITAHYISDEWELTKKILSFRPLLSPHTGQVIADRLSQVLLEWKILNKLAFVTLDNASSNNLAISRLQQFINDCSQ